MTSEFPPLPPILPPPPPPLPEGFGEPRLPPIPPDRAIPTPTPAEPFTPGPNYLAPWQGTDVSYQEFIQTHEWVDNPDYRPILRFTPPGPALPWEPPRPAPPPEPDFARGRWVPLPAAGQIGGPIQPPLPPPVQGYSPVLPEMGGPFDAWRRPSVYQFQSPFWGNLWESTKDAWEQTRGSYRRGMTRAGRIMRSPGWRLVSGAYSAYQWAQYAAALQRRTGIQSGAQVGTQPGPAYTPRPGPIPPYAAQPRGRSGTTGPASFPIAGGPQVDLAGFFGSMAGWAAQTFLSGQEGYMGIPGMGTPIMQGPPGAMPGGARFAPGPMITPARQAGFDLPFIDIAPQGTMGGMGGTCITPQARGSVGYPSTVQFLAPTPSGSTRVKTYKDKGSCLLYSDDLAACKRVKRVAARARRAVGGGR